MILNFRFIWQHPVWLVLGLIQRSIKHCPQPQFTAGCWGSRGWISMQTVLVCPLPLCIQKAFCVVRVAMSHKRCLRRKAPCRFLPSQRQRGGSGSSWQRPAPWQGRVGSAAITEVLGDTGLQGDGAEGGRSSSEPTSTGTTPSCIVSFCICLSSTELQFLYFRVMG